MSPSPFAVLPPEVIEHIVEALPTREALLAFSHTCSTFRAIASRGTHLIYSHVTLSLDHHKSFWEHLIANPRLARCVRVLVLIDDPERASGPAPCTPLRYCNRAEETETESRETASAEQIIEACRNMSGVARIKVRYVRKDVCRRVLDALSIICEEFPHVEEVALRGSSMACSREDEVARMAAHPIWTSNKIKAFNMDFVLAKMWPVVRTMLHPSSALEELKIPAGILSSDDTAVALFTCRLPHLKRLHVGVLHAWHKPYLMRFLEAHRTLESVSWDGHCLRYDRVLPCSPPPISRSPLAPGALPNLKHLSTMNGCFLKRVLRGKPPGSMHVQSIGAIPLTPRFLHLLSALDPATLTHIRLAATSDPALLPLLSAQFPNISSLEVGAFEWCSDFGTMMREAVGHAVGHVLLRRRSPYERMEGMELSEAVRIFPQLEVAKGVKELRRGGGEEGRFDEEEIRQARERYPGLLMVNDVWVR